MNKDTYILSAKAIAEMPGRLRTHFLNSGASRVEKALGEAAGMREIGFNMIEIAPGEESTEHHKHYHEEECIYVIEGTGTARIGSDSHEIGPGDFVGCRKGGLAHSLKNTGDQPLRCISVSQRKDHDVSDYPRVGKRLYRNRDLTWNLVDLSVIDRPFGSKT